MRKKFVHNLGEIFGRNRQGTTFIILVFYHKQRVNSKEKEHTLGRVEKCLHFSCWFSNDCFIILLKGRKKNFNCCSYLFIMSQAYWTLSLIYIITKTLEHLIICQTQRYHNLGQDILDFISGKTRGIFKLCVSETENLITLEYFFSYRSIRLMRLQSLICLLLCPMWLYSSCLHIKHLINIMLFIKHILRFSYAQHPFQHLVCDNCHKIH